MNSSRRGDGCVIGFGVGLGVDLGGLARGGLENAYFFLPFSK